MNEKNEMSNVTRKLCELNSFHSHKERNKQTNKQQVTSKNGLAQSSKMVQMCLAYRAPEVWKNVSVVGSAICWSHILSLVGQGLQHMQILVSQN